MEFGINLIKSEQYLKKYSVLPNEVLNLAATNLLSILWTILPNSTICCRGWI